MSVSGNIASWIDKQRRMIHHSKAMDFLKKTPLHPFLRVIYRRYIWVLSKTVSDYEHVVNIEGSKSTYHVKTGDDFTHIVSLDGEKPVITDLLASVEPDDVFYDIGSHLGLYACLTARKTKKVYCFEPHPANRKALNSNIELNSLDNIEIIDYALSNNETTFSMEKSDTKASAALSDNGGIEIDALPGDKLISDGDIDSPNIVKIDVEGHEYEVVEGLSNCLEDTCRILYCEVHPQDIQSFGHTVEEFYSLIENLGFKDIEVIHDRGPQKFIKASK